MRQSIAAYIACLVVVILLDFSWLSLTGSRLYGPRIGELLRPRPVLWAAAGFYLMYAVGIVVFAVTPGLRAASWVSALWHGALLGLVAYGTYDFTNQATLKVWSKLITVTDMSWGAVLTATAATVAYLVAARLG